MQKHASEMKIVTFTDNYCCFITFCCFVMFYLRFIDLFYSILFIPCHVLSIMMFKCTLMKEQINFLKIKKIKTKFLPFLPASKAVLLKLGVATTDFMNEPGHKSRVEGRG